MKVWALLLGGRSEVYPEDVQELAKYVLGHRVWLGPHAASHGVTVDMVIEDVLEQGAGAVTADTLVTLSEIAEIELFILKRMKEFTLGDHASVFKGGGFNFVGMRDWQPGDRMSSIDWAQSSLTNFSPLITREFEQDSTATIIAVADASLSTRCGLDGVTIATAIARGVAAVGLSATFFQDLFGLVAFDAALQPVAAARPRIGRSHLLYCLGLYRDAVEGRSLASRPTANRRSTCPLPERHHGLVFADPTFPRAPRSRLPSRASCGNRRWSPSSPISSFPMRSGSSPSCHR